MSIVTEGYGSELEPVPAAFVAVTVNVYAVFWVSPVTVTGVLAVAAVTSPGSEVTTCEAETVEGFLWLVDQLPQARGSIATSNP